MGQNHNSAGKIELDGFQKLAVSITHNAKGQALLQALKTAFEKADKIGASRKAIIFTEYRRTQSYLLRVLADLLHERRVPAGGAGFAPGAL